MKIIPAPLSATVVSSLVFFCLGTALAQEATKRFLDADGRPLLPYRIETVLPAGIVLRTQDRTFLINPVSPELKNRLIKGATALKSESMLGGVSEPSFLFHIAAPKPSPILPGYGSPTARRAAIGRASPDGFAFSLSQTRSNSINTVTRILQTHDQEYGLAQIVKEQVSGAGRAHELPWEFVGNEMGMLAVWFLHGDETNPEDAAISNYMRQQHSPQMLLYRLLIRPFLRDKN